jgi:hypothetical protein
MFPNERPNINALQHTLGSVRYRGAADYARKKCVKFGGFLEVF